MQLALKEIIISVIYWTFFVCYVVTIRFVGIDFVLIYQMINPHWIFI